jgi:cytidylate kinase
MAVITVSRQYGSCGDDIANRVSVILGYRYFDKNLLVEIAEQVGLSREEIVHASAEYHRVAGRPDSPSAGTRPHGEGVSGAESLGDLQALDANERVALVERCLRLGCKQDNIVIVGRGGQALFQGVPNVLHVRIEAPLEVRVRRVQEGEHLSESDARARIAERETAAANYLRRFYKIDWADPYLYHLWLNTGRWDVESAARIIATAAACLSLHRTGSSPQGA